MRWFAFLFTVRFWAAAWVAILFIGLMPLPPLAELLIVVAFVAHGAWFIQRRVRRAAALLALARTDRAEEADFRRLRRRRSPHGDGSIPTSAGPMSWH
jgi:hypothetical protein